MKNDALLSKKFFWKKWLQLGLKYVKKSDFVRIVILLLAGAAAGWTLPVLSQKLYQNYLPKADQQGFLRFSMFLIVMVTGNVVVLILRNLCIFQGLRTMEYGIQREICGKIFQLSKSYFAEYDVGDIARRIMEVSVWLRGVWNAAANIVLSACLSLCYLCSMFSYSVKLALIAAGVLEFSLLLTVVFGVWGLQYQEQKLELEGESVAIVYQLLKGITRVRATAAEAEMQKLYEKPYLQAKKYAFHKGCLETMTKAVCTAVPGISAIAVYLAVMGEVSDAEMGMLLAFFTAFGFCCGAVQQIAEGIAEIFDILPLYRRCRPILEVISDQDEAAEISLKLIGEIEVEGVHFSYEQESILDDISFHISPGECVGIAGASGCGKSTLLKLLLGFERPIEGNIYYDGKNLNDLNLSALRLNFGVVLQGDQLIPGSIYKNITMAATEATEESVRQVLKAVGLEEDLAQMPMGWHTILTEDSELISGGQKQRILLARALLRNPQVLFLDEATSALDQQNQKLINTLLSEKKITRIVIAHRPQPLQGCDKILVLEQGRIVEQGNYQELMSKKGEFYKLQE